MKKAVSLFLLFFLVGCVSSSDQLRRGRSSRRGSEGRGRTVSRNYDYRKNYRLNNNKLLAVIKQWMGTPYCMGGSTKKCTDCSGFVQRVFSEVNRAGLPRTSKKQYRLGKKVAKGNLKIGDLVFFAISKRRVSHVGIYVGDSRFAHASTTAGVIYSSLQEKYFKTRYAGARRIF